MAGWKRSKRAPLAASPLPRLPRGAWAALGWVLAAVYGAVFLRQPIAEELKMDGAAVSRAAFVLGSLLYPEGLVDSWLDAGRLPVGILDRLPVAVATLLWLSLAAVAGLPVVDRVLVRAPSRAVRLERISWAALVGLALLSTVTLLVGLAGGLHSRGPLAAAIVVLTALLYGSAKLVRRRETAGEEQPETHAPSLLEVPPLRGLFERAAAVVMIALVVWSAAATMLGAWVPASEFDVLEYHLQAPKEFFQLGSIRFLPHNVYANMPLGTEMHTLAMMTLVGQTDPWWAGLIGKSITAALSLIGAALLGGYLARKFGSLCGWWAAGLWLATPGIAHVAMLGLIDGALATYVLATVLCVMQATQSWRAGIQSDRSAVLGWWGLAGVMAGAAAAAKYPGLIFAVAPACAALALRVGTGWYPGQGKKLRAESPLPLRQRWLASILFTLGLVVTCAPWYAKNWVQAGNPVYPLAANIFGGETLTASKIEQWQRAHRVPTAAPAEASVAERVIAILRVAAKDAGRLLLSSPYVQPAIVCGLGAAVCFWLRRRTDRGGNLGIWLGWSLWIVGVWWLATHRIDRFWLPVTGLWAAMSAIGLCWIRGSVTPWLAHAIVISGLIYGALFNSSSLVSDNRFFVSLAALRDDVSTEEQIGRVPAALAWINQNLSASDSRLLLVGEARVFEYQVPVLYSTCFDVNPGEVMLRGKSPTEQSAALRERGITHIMIHWGEIARYRSPGNYGFSDWPQPADVEQMIADGVLSRVEWSIPKGSVELLKVQ